MKWVPAARNFSVRQNFLPSNETSFLRTENQSGAEQFCLARNASVTFDLHLVHSLSRQMSDLSLCLGDVAFAIARAPSSRRTGPRYRLAQSSWLEHCSDQASYESQLKGRHSSIFAKSYRRCPAFVRSGTKRPSCSQRRRVEIETPRRFDINEAVGSKVRKT